MTSTTRQVFVFFWKDGKREVLTGSDAADALNKAGYRRGALRALDFYAAGEDGNWQWLESDRKWVPREGV